LLQEKRTVKLILMMLFFSAVLIGCAGSPTPIPDSASRGALTFAKRCSACHSLPHPKRHRYAEWRVIVDVMEVHMREKRIAPLTAEERTLILGYLKGNSR
jgi:hypothetical protein